MWAIEPPVFHAVTEDWAGAPMVVSGCISVKKPVLRFDESKTGAELQDREWAGVDDLPLQYFRHAVRDSV